MWAVKKDLNSSSPVLNVRPLKPDDLPFLAISPAKPEDLSYLAVCPPNPADLHGSFLEPPPLEVQISASNLDYHEPPPSPSTELPPKQFTELRIDENAPIICICPPSAILSSEEK
ncbi:hypothetical protein ACFFRR_009362 [Megaselia abdita]